MTSGSCGLQTARRVLRSGARDLVHKQWKLIHADTSPQQRTVPIPNPNISNGSGRAESSAPIPASRLSSQPINSSSQATTTSPKKSPVLLSPHLQRPPIAQRTSSRLSSPTRTAPSPSSPSPSSTPIATATTTAPNANVTSSLNGSVPPTPAPRRASISREPIPPRPPISARRRLSRAADDKPMIGLGLASAEASTRDPVPGQGQGYGQGQGQRPERAQGQGPPVAFPDFMRRDSDSDFSPAHLGQSEGAMLAQRRRPSWQSQMHSQVQAQSRTSTASGKDVNGGESMISGGLHHEAESAEGSAAEGKGVPAGGFKKGHAPHLSIDTSPRAKSPAHMSPGVVAAQRDSSTGSRIVSEKAPQQSPTLPNDRTRTLSASTRNSFYSALASSTAPGSASVFGPGSGPSSGTSSPAIAPAPSPPIPPRNPLRSVSRPALLSMGSMRSMSGRSDVSGTMTYHTASPSPGEPYSGVGEGAGSGYGDGFGYEDAIAHRRQGYRADSMASNRSLSGSQRRDSAGARPLSIGQDNREQDESGNRISQMSIPSIPSLPTPNNPHQPSFADLAGMSSSSLLVDGPSANASADSPVIGEVLEAIDVQDGNGVGDAVDIPDSDNRRASGEYSWGRKRQGRILDPRDFDLTGISPEMVRLPCLIS